jgi:hydrogenase maturation factor
MRVVTIQDDGTALCDGDVTVMTDLVEAVAPGDELLVHAGTAIAKQP